LIEWIVSRGGTNVQWFFFFKKNDKIVLNCIEASLTPRRNDHWELHRSHADNHNWWFIKIDW